jgi:hypothetical protein
MEPVPFLKKTNIAVSLPHATAVHIEYKSALHYVMVRGNRRKQIFASPESGIEGLFSKAVGGHFSVSIWAWTKKFQ